MSEINFQQTFDTIARHLLTQNKMSNAEGACAYRGKGGLQCAIGCLIKDEFYEASMESRSVYALRVTMALYKSLDIVDPGTQRDDFLSMLASLQGVHDTTPVSHWPLRLERVAKHNGLNPGVITETLIALGRVPSTVAEDQE